jgi:hypothetical protein
MGIVRQDDNVLWFKVPVLCRACHARETVNYAKGVEPTHEKFANVLRVVDTTVQFLDRSRVVDSDLNGCGIRHRQVGLKGRKRFARIRTQSAFFLPVQFEQWKVPELLLVCCCFGRGGCTGAWRPEDPVYCCGAW